MLASVLCELISLSICATLNLLTVGCIQKKGKDKLSLRKVYLFFPFVTHRRRDALHASAHACSFKADHYTYTEELYQEGKNKLKCLKSVVGILYFSKQRPIK